MKAIIIAIGIVLASSSSFASVYFCKFLYVSPTGSTESLHHELVDMAQTWTNHYFEGRDMAFSCRADAKQGRKFLVCGMYKISNPTGFPHASTNDGSEALSLSESGFEINCALIPNSKI